MLYFEKDIKEFSIQIKELLEKRLIQPSNAAYSSPACWYSMKQKNEQEKLEWLSTIKK